MHKKMKTGDELLAEDVQYIRSRVPQKYFAYPSRSLPWVLVPARDEAAKRFIVRMMASHRPLARYALFIPGMLWFLSRLMFRDRV